MIMRKFSLVVISILLLSALVGLTSSQPVYDPWVDTDDDGDIDIFDIVYIAGMYGTTGTPINKTALLLSLQARVNSLNASLLNLESKLDTRVPKKGYINISPTAFTPNHDAQGYLKTPGAFQGDWIFYAPVQFPDGVTVINLTAKFTDASNTGFVNAYLHRTPMYIAPGGVMAQVTTDTPGTPGEVVLSDTSINMAQIDNANFTYCVQITLSYEGGDLSVKWVLIEYVYSA